MINAIGPGQDENEPEEFEFYDDEECYNEDYYDYDYDNDPFGGGDSRDTYRDIGESDYSYDYSYYGNGHD